MGAGGAVYSPANPNHMGHCMFEAFQIAYQRRNVRVKEARPLNFLRETTAFLLSQQARNVSHAAGIIPLDVTNVIEYGKSRNANAGDSEELSEKRLLRRAIHKNFSAFFLKALANTLHHIPELNGFIDYTPLRNGGTFYLAEDVNVSFTVHSQYGVVRPIVRNAHLKDLETVAQEMRILTRKARRTNINDLYDKCAQAYFMDAIRQVDLGSWRAGWTWLRSRLIPRTKDTRFHDTPPEMQLTVADVLGSTTTLANIGMSVAGYQTVTVIIPPEVTMFGLGNIELVPRVVKGEIVPRYMMNSCITLDHRALDGGDVFAFGETMQRYMDNPALVYDYKAGDAVP